MIEFETYSGSLYQVDEANKRIRRVTGNHPPVPNQNADGEWQEFAEISDVKVDRCVFILWGEPRTKHPYTQTSFVTEVREVPTVAA